MTLTIGSKIMKRTFKYLAFAAAAAIAFSCEKETATVNEEVATPSTPQEEEPVVPSADEYDPSVYLLSFGAKFENEDTKATIDIDGGTVAFVNGDKALVYVPASGETGVYTYDGTQFAADATPVALGENAAEVYYPASCYDVDGGAVKFTMPAAVTDIDDLGTKNPMAGQIAAGDHSAGITVNFKNVCSILRVQLTGNRALASLTLANDNVPIAADGAYTVSWSGENPQIESAATTCSATITSSAALSDSAIDFFFLLPPTAGTMDNMKISATMASADALGLSSYVLSRNGAMSLARNKIVKVPFFAGLFSGGEGTEANPFIIANSRDFKNLQTYTVGGYDNGVDAAIAATTFLGAHYKQTAAINAGSMTPIGTSTAAFTGVYDGQGNTLSVTISTSTDNTGVFGYLDGATIKDLSVSGTVSCTAGMYTGGIVGQMNASTISGCTNRANITNNTTGSNSYSAGIVARATDISSKVVSCINEGTITANKPFAGGIAGDMNGTIDMCINRGIIKGSSSNVGGITGSLRANSIVKRCYSAAWTDGKPYIKGSARVGGIVGIQNGAGSQVVNCMNRSLVKETSTSSIGVGGIVGVLTNGFVGNCLAGDSYVINTGDASSYVGMIVGYVNADGVVQNCYSRRVANNLGYFTNSDGSTTVTRKTSAANNTTVMGQVYGYLNGGTAKDCYYRGHSSGVATGGTKSGSTKTNVTLVSTSTTTGFSDASDQVPVSITLSDGVTYPAETMMIWEILSVGANLIEGYTPAGDELMGWRYSGDNSDPAVPAELYRLGEDFFLN